MGAVFSLDAARRNNGRSCWRDLPPTSEQPLYGSGSAGGIREPWPAMFHISIRRNDREPIHDWSDLQRIKNEIVGPENEAVELYPAESRLLDAANQFHMFVLEDAKIRFPFGYEERVVSESSIGGSKQRPWPAGARPVDLKTITDEDVKRGTEERAEVFYTGKIVVTDGMNDGPICINCKSQFRSLRISAHSAVWTPALSDHRLPHSPAACQVDRRTTVQRAVSKSSRWPFLPPSFGSWPR